MGVRIDLTGKKFGKLTVIRYDHTNNLNKLCWLCECDCGNRVVVDGGSLKSGNTSSCGCYKHEHKPKDLTGKKFGKLTVVKYDRTDKYGHSYWLCECECGNKIITNSNTLKNGDTTSCGCIRRDDLTGRRFGKLTVLEYDHTDIYGNANWLCECDCGNRVVVRSHNLKIGHTKSCGCYIKDLRTTHGMYGTRLYGIWNNMRQRCENESDHAYCKYGNRGIKVCDEWKYFENFYNWAINNGYNEELSIDRIDNDGGYCPDNCRWVDRIMQANNRSNNRFITYNDNTHTLAQWTRILDVNYNTLQGRINRNDYSDFERYFENT